jgi:hypothetical protein
MSQRGLAHPGRTTHQVQHPASHGAIVTGVATLEPPADRRGWSLRFSGVRMRIIRRRQVRARGGDGRVLGGWVRAESAGCGASRRVMERGLRPSSSRTARAGRRPRAHRRVGRRRRPYSQGIRAAVGMAGAHVDDVRCGRAADRAVPPPVSGSAGQGARPVRGAAG